ncbi:alpha/beta hydrolase [Aquipseudomonas alcaligenes]|uniref:alpha/beta hydrolase n=1 Tax=Aquipseudomonas alcaligenes TaxID=43263 RepID=UPI0037480D77
MRRLVLIALAMAGALLGGASAMAHERKEQLMDGRLLQREDLAYRFSSFDLDSADGQRHYRVWLGQPKAAAPATGYPVLWMLDGNAAIGVLDAALLQRLAEGSAPLLVALGYQTPLRIERQARVFDYTPPRDGQVGLADAFTGEATGGADIFLDLFEQGLRPQVARRVAFDAKRQTLWGHSYGGLLVLRALFSRPQLVGSYVAASPSLWWAGDALLAGRKAAPVGTALLLTRGSAEVRKGAGEQPSGEQALAALAAELRADGLPVELKTFPGLDHGPAFAASLRYLLESRFATQP